MSADKESYKYVKVGMFGLPGIKFSKDLDDETLTEFIEWSKANNCGTCMGTTLWSFKSPAARDMFVLKFGEKLANLNFFLEN